MKPSRFRSGFHPGKAGQPTPHIPALFQSAQSRFNQFVSGTGECVGAPGEVLSFVGTNSGPGATGMVLRCPSANSISGLRVHLAGKSPMSQALQALIILSGNIPTHTKTPAVSRGKSITLGISVRPSKIHLFQTLRIRHAGAFPSQIIAVRTLNNIKRKTHLFLL